MFNRADRVLFRKLLLLTNEQLTTCESALSSDKTIPHKTGLVIRVSGLCPSSVTNGLDIGRSAIVDNCIEELRCSFIQCVANVSRLLKLHARGDIPVFVALSQVPTFALVH